MSDTVEYKLRTDRQALPPEEDDSRAAAYGRWNLLRGVLKAQFGLTTTVEIDYDFRSRKYVSYLTWVNIHVDGTVRTSQEG